MAPVVLTYGASASWTVPAGVTLVEFELRGGAGGGAGAVVVIVG